MTAVADGLARLRATERTSFGGTLVVPLNAEQILGALVEAIAVLEAAPSGEKRPSKATLLDAKSSWAAAHGDVSRLTGREVRALCWDTDSAVDPAFVRAVSQHPDLLQSRRWIEGLVLAYFAKWRSMPEPEALELVLRKAVGAFPRRNPRFDLYRRVVANLFSADAAKSMGTTIVTREYSIADFMHSWKIDPASGLGEAIANEAVNVWAERHDREKYKLRGDAALRWVRQLTHELLPSSMVGAMALTRAVSTLIMWDQAEADPQVHAAILTFLLEDPRFRDPRLPNRHANWDLCAEAARQRVVGWLAKGDLLFFFKFIIRDDPHHRRDFWLRYIGQAVDASVALSDEDHARLRAQVRDKLSYARTDGATSAFLMRFRGASKDFLCIEFAETGNALHVHDADAFVQRFKSIRRPRFNLRTELKNTTTLVQKFSHFQVWQYRVQSYLSRYGIRPN